jgi:hypothetical protein
MVANLASLFAVVVILSGCNLKYSPINSKLSMWIFVEGSGINYDSSKTATYPQLTVFNSKLYTIWTEGTTVSQIRVSVYNGNDDAPARKLVDGNGVNGINHDSTQSAFDPQLTVFNSKLYATWYEGNGTAYQIRIAVYNGNDNSPAWSFVDGNGVNGINKDVTKSAFFPQLTVFNSKLYSTWSEAFGAEIYQIRMAVYNGNDGAPAWSFVDGNGVNSINKDATKSAYNPQLTVFNSKLYSTWFEFYGSKYQIRMAVYNGNDGAPAWSFVDGNGVTGINKDVTKHAYNPQLIVFNSKLYSTWYEYNSYAYQIRMAVYNGNDGAPAWSFVDGNGINGINKGATNQAYYPQLTVFNSKLYSTWSETSWSETTNNYIYQTRVAVYNGNDGAPEWSFVDGNDVTGLNKDATKQAYYPQLIVFNSKLYASWFEFNGSVNQIRMVVGQGLH